MIQSTPDSHSFAHFKLMARNQDFDRKLAERIKRARLQKGLTQVQVAQELGIQQPAFAKYELGERQPTLATLPKLAELLEISIEELLGVGNSSKAKPGPKPKLVKKFEEIKALPPRDQDFVMRLIDTAIREAARKAS